MPPIESDLSTDGAMALLAGVSSEAPDAVDDENAVIDNDEDENDSDAEASSDTDNVDADSSDADGEGEADLEVEATDDAEDGEEQVEQDNEPAIDPPTGLDETQREVFKKLPREAQKILADHDRALVADHTRKTQALAAERKELQSRISALREVKTEKQRRIEKWEKVDWADLATKLDPKEWNRQKALMEKEVGEYRSLESSLRRQEEADYAQHIREQAPELQRIAPHLAGNDEKAVAARKEIMDLALAAGYSRKDLAFMSAFEMHSLWKAQQWDKYQAERSKKPSITARKGEKQPGRNIKPTSRANPPSGVKAVVQTKFKKAPSQANAIVALNAMDVD